MAMGGANPARCTSQGSAAVSARYPFLRTTSHRRSLAETSFRPLCLSDGDHFAVQSHRQPRPSVQPHAVARFAAQREYSYNSHSVRVLTFAGAKTCGSRSRFTPRWYVRKRYKGPESALWQWQAQGWLRGWSDPDSQVVPEEGFRERVRSS